jgi:hypothetical protein
MRHAVLIAIGVAVVAASGGFAHRAAAAPSPRYYSTTLSTGTAPAGATLTETLTLTNKSVVPLGSELVTVPSGYAASVVSVTGPPTSWLVPHRDWHASVSSGTLTLTAANILGSLIYGESVKVVLSVTVPCVAPASTVWATQASGSIPFLPLSGFVPLPGTTDPSITATGNCSFAFDTIPSPQIAGAPISVGLHTLDGAGHTSTAFNGAATLSGTFSSTGGAPGYSPLSFTNGSASGSATDYTKETGRTLAATAGAITGTSNAFDVNPGPAYALKFVQQPPVPPAKVQKGVAISPAVTVGVFDQWGNQETVPGLNQATVVLGIGTDPFGGTTLGGGTPGQLSVNGVATFASLTLNHGGSGFTLTASSAGLAGDTSTPFNVYDAVCNGAGCSASNADGSTSVNTSGNVDIQLSPSGEQFGCGGTVTAIGSIITIQPGAGYTPAHPLRLSFSYPTASITATFCKSPDGTTWKIVPNCRKLRYDGDNDYDDNYYAADLPCIENRDYVVQPVYGYDSHHKKVLLHAGTGLKFTLVMTSDDPFGGLH